MKKLFIALILILPVIGCSSPSFFGISNSLEADKADIIKIEIRNDEVEYAYKTTKEIPLGTFIVDGKQYRETERTPNARIDRNNKIGIFYAKDSFYWENSKWLEIQYATTTKENYELQTNTIISRLFYKFFKVALATNFTTSADANIYNQSAVSWATVHDASTGTLDGGVANAYPSAYNISGTYTDERYFANIDTSAIGSGQQVDSTTYCVAGKEIYGTDAASYFNVYNSSHSNPIVAGDFDLAGLTAWSAAPIALISFVTNNTACNNSWAFNAAGKLGVNMTGITQLSIREDTYDVANLAPNAGKGGYIGFRGATYGTSGLRPYLAVTWSAVATVQFYPELLLMEE